MRYDYTRSQSLFNNWRTMKNSYAGITLFVTFLAISVAADSRFVRADDAPPASTKSVASSLQPFVDSHALAGAVALVASKDKVLDVGAVGFADIAQNKPMRPDCLFWIASMSKPITATALMMLVDEGKVNVDDPVEKYLPEFHGQMVMAEHDDNHVLLKKPVHPILVRNVLSHTSGLPFMSRIEHHIDQHPLREAVISYGLTNLNTEPDANYAYANAGINTAGRIIEIVSGMPYEEFLQKRLFDPLGMKDTTFFPKGEQLERLAKSYHPNKNKDGLDEMPIEQLTYPLDGPGRYPSPAGGLFSTAADVGVFGQMILNGGQLNGKRYVSEAAVRQMTSKQTGNLGANYGFGFSVSKKIEPGSTGPAPAGACGHGGAYSTDLSIDPENGLVLVYMVQHAGYAGPDGGKIKPTFDRAARDTYGKH